MKVVRVLALALVVAAGHPEVLDNAIPEYLKPPKLDLTREGRFPSIEERVKVYMSNWYLPPCSSEGKVHYQFQANASSSWKTLWIHEPRDLGDLNHSASSSSSSQSYVMESAIEPDKAFFLDRETLLDCTRNVGIDSMFEDRVQQRRNMRLYCPDAAGSLLTALDHVLWERHVNNMQHPPILIQFGDMRYSHVYKYMNVPLIKKFRSATSKEEIARVTTTDITASSTATTAAAAAATTAATVCAASLRGQMMQTAHDHVYNSTSISAWTLLQPVVWKLSTKRHFGMLDHIFREDTPWEAKVDMAAFRGQLTGAVDDGYQKHLSDEENCLRLRRCRLVYEHGNSTLVYARLTSTRNRMPEVLNGVELVAPSVTIRRLLAFKGIIMLEGNDVASGLKWALLSQSVVLMPRPKHTSWAMEELLEPWVHYIPLNDDAMDVEEKMQWVVDNDEHARHIAQRGSLWMQDLVFHPDAMEDDRLIQEEILRRYMAHFEQVV